MTTRLYIPAYGPDQDALEDGMNWLLDSSENDQLFLYVLDNSMVQNGRKLLCQTYGEELCEGLRKHKSVVFRGRRINLLTKRRLDFTPDNAKILALYPSSKALDAIEKKLIFSELLVVCWNRGTDLSSWIEKKHAEQYDHV